MTTTDTVTPVASPTRRTSAFLVALGIAAVLFLPSAASAQVALGTAQNFGVLGGSTVTNIGPSVIAGDVGVAPGGAIVGFPPGSFTGSSQGGNATAGQGQSDLTLAYNAAAGTACNTDLTGIDLGGLTLTPGVYCFTGSAQLTGNLTLDFQGNPAAAFLFKTASTLTTASNSSVLAINTGGATCLPNINFQVGSSATLGTTSNIAGNILALTSITLNTGANLRGRALARNGAVTLDSNLAVGGCPIAAAVPGGPIPGAGGGGGAGGGVNPAPTLQEWNLILLGLLLACYGWWHSRRTGTKRRS